MQGKESTTETIYAKKGDRTFHLETSRAFKLGQPATALAFEQLAFLFTCKMILKEAAPIVMTSVDIYFNRLHEALVPRATRLMGWITRPVIIMQHVKFIRLRLPYLMKDFLYEWRHLLLPAFPRLEKLMLEIPIWTLRNPAYYEDIVNHAFSFSARNIVISVYTPAGLGISGLEDEMHSLQEYIEGFEEFKAES